MKRTAFILLIIFSTIRLFAQIGKGDMIISLNGSYFQTNTGQGVSTNYMSTYGKYLSVGTSFEYLVTEKFVVGFGLDFNYNKELVLSRLFLFDSYMQQDLMEYKSKALVPDFYIGYYQQIVNKLFFNASFIVSYAKYHTEYIGNIASRRDLTSDSLATYFSYTLSIFDEYVEDEIKNDFLSARLCPEIIYFINENFGIYIDLGEISYSIIDWESDNSIWMINFNPNHWKLGVKFKF
jgi:hypothetical protein